MARRAPEPPAAVNTYTGYADQRAHALALWQSGQRNVSAIARTVGRPRTTVHKWLAHRETLS